MIDNCLNLSIRIKILIEAVDKYMAVALNLLFSLCGSGNSNFSSKNGDLTGNLNLELPLLHFLGGGIWGRSIS